MSAIVSDPSTLTKDKLKKELAKFDVEIPSPDARKSVYVELYRQHVLNQTSEFSADEEGSPKPRKKKTTKKPSKKMSTSAGVDVTALSDDELLAMLKTFGVEMGPILPSTKKVYQKKLQKLLSGAGEPAPISDSNDTVPVEDMDFSAESEPEPEPEPPKVVPQSESVRRRQTRSSPPRKAPPSPSRAPAKPQPPAPAPAPAPTPPRQRTQVPAPRTPPKLPQDARPIPSSRTRSLDQTDGRSSTKPVQKKSWMSIWIQIALVVLVALVIFFVFQNMEPAAKDPLKGLDREIP